MILLIFFIYLQLMSIEAYDGFVTRLTFTPGKMYNAKLVFTNVTSGQSISGPIYMKEDLGNDNKFSLTIQRVFAKKSKTIFSLPGTGACTALETYLGEALLIGERNVKIEKVGECPIKKSNYTLTNYNVNYSEIKLLQLVPNGKYVVNAKLFDITGQTLKAELIVNFQKN